jgi:hypothetical protein
LKTFIKCTIIIIELQKRKEKVKATSMIHGLSAGISINEQGRFVNFLTEADRKI